MAFGPNVGEPVDELLFNADLDLTDHVLYGTEDDMVQLDSPEPHPLATASANNPSFRSTENFETTLLQDLEEIDADTPERAGVWMMTTATPTSYQATGMHTQHLLRRPGTGDVMVGQQDHDLQQSRDVTQLLPPRRFPFSAQRRIGDDVNEPPLSLSFSTAAESTPPESPMQGMPPRIDSPRPHPFTDNSGLPADLMDFPNSNSSATLPAQPYADSTIEPGLAGDFASQGRTDLALDEMDLLVPALNESSPHHAQADAAQGWRRAEAASRVAARGRGETDNAAVTEPPTTPSSVQELPREDTEGAEKEAGKAEKTMTTTEKKKGSTHRSKSSGQATTKASAKRRSAQSGSSCTPEHEEERKKAHRIAEQKRRRAISCSMKQLAPMLGFEGKAPQYCDVLAAVALTLAKRDTQACYGMLRDTPPKQLELMRKQRNAPQLSSEERYAQRQLTAEIVNLVKIAMRAKTGKLPLQYPFTRDGLERGELFEGNDWAERFNAELKYIREYNREHVRHPVPADRLDAYCLLKFPAIDPKSLEEQKRTPKQSMSMKKHNVKERERRLYNKLLLVLIKHLCSAQGLCERRTYVAVKERIAAALSSPPTCNPYNDFFSAFKSAHAGSKKTEANADRA